MSSAADVGIATTLAITGLAMAPVPATLVGGVVVAAVAFGAILDLLKIPVFAKLRIE